LAERSLRVDHVTIWRWVQRYAPELERRLRRHLKPTNDSWRVDETYVRVKGKWVYLYRAVDSSGATIDFLLSAKRDAVMAQRFLTKARRTGVRRVRRSVYCTASCSSVRGDELNFRSSPRSSAPLQSCNKSVSALITPRALSLPSRSSDWSKARLASGGQVDELARARLHHLGYRRRSLRSRSAGKFAVDIRTCGKPELDTLKLNQRSDLNPPSARRRSSPPDK
jgi:hypothetical protein